MHVYDADLDYLKNVRSMIPIGSQRRSDLYRTSAVVEPAATLWFIDNISRVIVLLVISQKLHLLSCVRSQVMWHSATSQTSYTSTNYRWHWGLSVTWMMVGLNFHNALNADSWVKCFAPGRQVLQCQLPKIICHGACSTPVHFWWKFSLLGELWNLSDVVIFLNQKAYFWFI